MKTELTITKNGKNVKLRDDIKDKITKPKENIDDVWGGLLPTKNVEIFFRYNAQYRKCTINLDIYNKANEWFRNLQYSDKVYVLKNMDYDR